MPVDPWRLWRRIVVSFLRTTMGRDLGTNGKRDVIFVAGMSFSSASPPRIALSCLK